jgi:hypothetical protein
VETVHEGKKPFKCNICDAGFVSEADLYRLNASVHEGRKVQCDFCVSSFTKENNFQCSICDTRDWTATFVIRVFQIKAIWIIMWQQFMKERKKLSKCNICDAGFVSKGDLNRHIALQLAK